MEMVPEIVLCSPQDGPRDGPRDGPMHLLEMSEQPSFSHLSINSVAVPKTADIAGLRVKGVGHICAAVRGMDQRGIMDQAASFSFFLFLFCLLFVNIGSLLCTPYRASYLYLYVRFVVQAAVRPAS